MENINLHNGNSAEVLKQYPDNYFDSIVTDPPYGIEFLGKDWDNNTGAIEVWQECLRVLKPGGYMLAFSAARTYHRLATNLEDIGFEIKDQIMWIYSSGFPKAQDVGKQIEKKQNKRKSSKGIGNGTFDSGDTKRFALDCPKCEKRAKNVKNQYTQCVNDDNECPMEASQKPADNEWAGWKTGLKPAHEPIVMCRKPLDNRMGKRGKMKSRLNVVENVEKWGVGALNIDATRVGDGEIKSWIKNDSPHSQYNNIGGEKTKWDTLPPTISQGRFPSNVIGEIEGYQQYFYCPKVNRKERHWGVDANTHPTIKPVALMLYLVKMITPPNGKVLDCFNGSGSTGMAVKEFGGEYVGIDLDENYIEISRKRINAWNKK